MKISFIFGTRPEAIKLAPVILKMKQDSFFEVQVCVTAQHREMLDQVLDIFCIKPEFDLQLMRPNQTLSELTSNAISSIDKYLRSEQPYIIMVQGDTTSVFSASLAAFYNKIKVGHVEAGLRTWNKYSPFPEEINRVMTTHLADFHFAPTETSMNNLLKENIDASKIFITGNTVIDALMMSKEKLTEKNIIIEGLPSCLFELNDNSKVVLITGHRRENFGEGFLNICEAIKHLALNNTNVFFIYPVHLNPNVQKPVNEILGKLENVYLIPPQQYLQFIWLMNKATVILTDSGGVQEEAPALHKPVLVMRDTTERPEALATGKVKLVGTNTNIIVNEVQFLLDNPMTNISWNGFINPFGNGRASEIIIDVLKKKGI